METLEVTEQLSDYELERGKPMPSKNHGLVQGNMTIALGIKYRKEYSFLTELTLEFGEKNYVPDICIYPKQTYDGRNDEIRVTAPPLTAIEILSPKQGSEEIMKKLTRILLTACNHAGLCSRSPIRFSFSRPTRKSAFSTRKP